MEKIKGVTSATIHGKTYWYARIDGKRKSFGSGSKGRKLAIQARKKFDVKEYENRELTLGQNRLPNRPRRPEPFPKAPNTSIHHSCAHARAGSLVSLYGAIRKPEVKIDLPRQVTKGR